TRATRTNGNDANKSESAEALRQQSSVERKRKQRAELVLSLDLSEICHHDGDVEAVLPEQLTAGTAGRSRFGRVGDNGDGDERPVAVGERLQQCHALGAYRQAVRRVLDVAALDDLPVSCEQGRPDLEVRVGRDRAGPRVARGLDERGRVEIRGGQ